MWWCTPFILVVWRQRQESAVWEFKAIVSVSGGRREEGEKEEKEKKKEFAGL